MVLHSKTTSGRDLASFLNAMPRREVAQPKELGTSWKMSRTPSKQEVSAPDQQANWPLYSPYMFFAFTRYTWMRLASATCSTHAAIERRAASIARHPLSVLLDPQRNLSIFLDCQQTDSQHTTIAHTLTHIISLCDWLRLAQTV